MNSKKYNNTFIIICLGIFLCVVGQLFYTQNTMAAGIGGLIKLPSDNNVYYLGSDNKRHWIPNISGYEAYKSAVMNSWGWVDDNVITVSQSELESYSLGENVFIKANTYHLKIETGVEIYNVEYDNVLKQIDSTANHPSGWNDFVVIPDAIFTSYKIIEEKPDLKWNSFDYTGPDSNQNNTILISAYSKNIGQAQANSGYNIKLEIYKNNSLVFNNTFTGQTALASDASSAFYHRTSYRFDQVGDYIIKLMVDGDNVVDESDEGNNIIIKTVKVAAITKPIISNINITNITQNSAKISWMSNGEHDCLLVYSEDSYLNKSISLSGKASNNYNYSQEIGLLKPVTKYYYRIRCSEQNNVNNYNETEILNFYTISAGLPDLTIQDFKFTDLRKDPTGPWAKDWDIQLEFYITNIGTTKPQSDFKLKVINLSLNNKEIQTETYFKGYFEPNNYRAHVYVVGDIINQNNSFIFGENKIKISVDDSNLVDESNENNNTLTKTIFIASTVDQKPDLTVKDIFYDNGLLKVKYCNEGTTSNKNSFGVGETFYIKMSANNKTHTGTSNSSNYVLSTPDPGECAYSDGYPASYFNLNSGFYPVTAEIDWQKVVAESNENNNTLTKTVAIGGSDDTGFLYNIIVTSITTNSATIKWTTSRAANSQVEYVESGGSIYDIKAKKDARYVTEHDMTLVDLKPETLYKYALTSYDQQGNVYGTTSLSSSVLGLHFTTLSESSQLKPDLVPIQLEVNNLTRPGNKIFKQNDIVEVQISFKNNGPADIHQEFFYTVEKDIGFGRLRSNILDLKAGETYKYTSKMLWPKDIASGDINFMFTVDSDNNIDESNEDNNTLFKKIILGSAIPIPIPTPLPTPTPSPTPSPSGKIAERLAGRLLLAVEDKGRIHYVNPDDQKRYEVTFGNVMSLFQNLALGISNADLNQILINPSSVSEDKDADGDGFNDKSEVMYGYNPELASNPANRGNDKIKVNTKLSDRLIGKLLLQVEDRGRIWYVDQSAKRWEVTFGNVINLFTSLALGITNQDLSDIAAGD